ncbi:UNVERIFIED_CONTAM: HEAT repeat-containing protein 2 [Siphonaria sp. JEL0065]|nr:HEAT repeat-containing protein 2 [Siphonaria sp. JEL0065]
MMAAPLLSVLNGLTSDEEIAADQLVKSLSVSSNIILASTSTKAQKRIAVERIAKESANFSRRPELATRVFEGLLKPLLFAFADSSEAVRERSIGAVDSLTTKAGDLVPVLPSLIPVLSARLAQPEIVESAEELRLKLVSLLLLIVEKSKQVFSPGVDESVKILSRTLIDPFPDVKKESCNLVVSLARHCPRILTPHVPPLVKVIIQNLSHRHAAVRIQALKAIQSLLLLDPSPLEDLSDHFRLLTMDKTPSVRDALFQMAVVLLAKMPDRYSIGYKVLPTLWAGLVDEVDGIRKSCWVGLEELGKLYEFEWEDRVKGEVDVDTGIGGVLLVGGFLRKEFLDRPRVGVRHLARDNVQKTVNKVVDGLQDWNVEVRAKTASVLHAFVPLAERNITGYMGILLPTIYRVLTSDDALVVKETLKAANVLGKFVEPDLYLNLLISHSKINPDSTATYTIGIVRALGAILAGTPAATLTSAHHSIIGKFLADKEMCGNEGIPLLLEVSKVAKVLAEKMAEAKSASADKIVGQEEGYLLFVVLVALLSARGNDKVPGWSETISNTEWALIDLSKAHGFDGTDGLFPLYFEHFLSTSLKATVHTWTRFSTTELRTLDTFLKRSGAVVGRFLEPVVQLFAEGLNIEKEIEVRQSLLTTFLDIIQLSPTPLNSAGSLSATSGAIIDFIVLPVTIWRAGRKLAPLRGLGMQIMASLIDPVHTTVKGEYLGYLPKSVMNAYLKEGGQYLPVTTACMEEDEVETRIVAVNALKYFLDGAVDCKLHFLAQHFKNTYPELLKRLDDASDNVRILSCSAVVSLTAAIKYWYSTNPAQDESGMNGVLDNGVYIETRLDDVHWVELVKGVVIHVDDANTAVQDSATAALVAVCRVAPREVVKEQLEGARKRFRNVSKLEGVCEELML